MAAKWGVRCEDPSCGLEKAMCLGHDNVVQDDAQENEDKMKLILNAVQELQAAMPELFDERNPIVEIALNIIKTRVIDGMREERTAQNMGERRVA